MLTLSGSSHRYCDGISRRSFLQIGSLAVGGLTLPNLLRAEQRSGSQKSRRSVIMVYLSGGLAHQDTFDLKPNAPNEVRGEFKPISTNVPGIQIGELLPRLARCDVLATVYHHLGIDPNGMIYDVSGRPTPILPSENRPIDRVF